MIFRGTVAVLWYAKHPKMVIGSKLASLVLVKDAQEKVLPVFIRKLGIILIGSRVSC